MPADDKDAAIAAALRCKRTDLEVDREIRNEYFNTWEDCKKFVKDKENLKKKINVTLILGEIAAILVGYIQKRELVLEEITESNDYVVNHCYFCKNFWNCKVVSQFKKEIESKGIKTFNADKVWWGINWRKDQDRDPLPVLKFYDKMKVDF